MDPKRFCVVECKGTPHQMGQQYGEAARGLIQTNLRIRRREEQRARGQGFIEKTRALLQQHVPDVLEELEGLAQGSGADLDLLILDNAEGTPMDAQCTSMAIPRSSDGPALGKNNDGNNLERGWVIQRCKPDKGLPTVAIQSAGWLSGLDGMNGAGLASSHNSAGSVFPRPEDGLEARFWTYHLLRTCTNLEEYLAGFDAIPLTGKGFNFMLLDAQGYACAQEWAPPQAVRRARDDPFLYAVNHFISDELAGKEGRPPHKVEVSTYRYGYLKWRDQENRPTSLDDLRGVLKSHDPWAPCRHGGPNGSHTWWSMIAQPQAGQVEIACGYPCETPYTTYMV